MMNRRFLVTLLLAIPFLLPSLRQINLGKDHVVTSDGWILSARDKKHLSGLL